MELHNYLHKSESFEIGNFCYFPLKTHFEIKSWYFCPKVNFLTCKIPYENVKAEAYLCFRFPFHTISTLQNTAASVRLQEQTLTFEEWEPYNFGSRRL
jgi:hypothetical protein